MDVGQVQGVAGEDGALAQRLALDEERVLAACGGMFSVGWWTVGFSSISPEKLLTGDLPDKVLGRVRQSGGHFD